jgi:hypothetical protein
VADRPRRPALTTPRFLPPWSIIRRRLTRAILMTFAHTRLRASGTIARGREKTRATADSG